MGKRTKQKVEGFLAAAFLIVALLVLQACGKPAEEPKASEEARVVTSELARESGDPLNADYAYDNAKIQRNSSPTVLFMDGSPRELNISSYDAIGLEPQRFPVHANNEGAPVGGGHYGGPDGFNTEAYDTVVHNAFRLVKQHPLSTFSTDVDTASYANIRRFLQQGQMPPAGAVRVEEMINYFDYDYPQPAGEHPFSVNVEVTDCPWKAGRRLARIGLKGKEIESRERPAANLVFLLDVSGSMSSPNKLELVKRSMKLLVEQTNPEDYIAIVVYAGASGLVLPSTSCDDTRVIVEALDRLQSGGSTNGGAGIQLAYSEAARNFIKGGINRVVLCTDGDFNVGTTNQGDLVSMIEQKAKTGVFLTVLGFGMGNYKDSTLEKLADKGNGNYGYIDSFQEARKVFVDQINGTLVTIAKDVKIQVEFNPAKVQAYRLIGYENRILAAEDFNDDTKDAGEVGAGHTVTALYEIVLPGEEIEIPDVDKLKYQEPGGETTGSDELLTVKLRYKQPDGDTSMLIEQPVEDEGLSYADAPEDHKFAAAVAEFGMILRRSPHKGSSSYAAVLELAGDAMSKDQHGYRKEFVGLVRAAQANDTTVSSLR